MEARIYVTNKQTRAANRSCSFDIAMVKQAIETTDIAIKKNMNRSPTSAQQVYTYSTTLKNTVQRRQAISTDQRITRRPAAISTKLAASRCKERCKKKSTERVLSRAFRPRRRFCDEKAYREVAAARASPFGLHPRLI